MRAKPRPQRTAVAGLFTGQKRKKMLPAAIDDQNALGYYAIMRDIDHTFGIGIDEKFDRHIEVSSLKGSRIENPTSFSEPNCFAIGTNAGTFQSSPCSKRLAAFNRGQFTNRRAWIARETSVRPHHARRVLEMADCS